MIYFQRFYLDRERDMAVELKASIPAISKTLMSQTKDYRLGVEKAIVKTYIRSVQGTDGGALYARPWASRFHPGPSCPARYFGAGRSNFNAKKDVRFRGRPYLIQRN